MASWRVPVSGPSRRTTYQNSFYYYYYVNILGKKKLSFFLLDCINNTLSTRKIIVVYDLCIYEFFKKSFPSFFAV